MGMHVRPRKQLVCPQARAQAGPRCARLRPGAARVTTTPPHGKLLEAVKRNVIFSWARIAMARLNWEG